MPAPSSMVRLPRTRDSPAGVARNDPKCSAGSQVLFPVVPAERRTPRDSEIVTVRSLVLLELVASVGAVYFIWETCWTVSRGLGLGVVRRFAHDSINGSRISCES